MRALTLAIALTLPLSATAQENPAVEARQSYFKLLGANMGVLAGMARGKVDYDEAAASTAAGNIEALTAYNPTPHFPAGTSEFDLGNDVTEAKVEIWDNLDDFVAKYGDLVMAAKGASEAVKGGQASVGPVVAKLGGTCKACHDDYRIK